MPLKTILQKVAIKDLSIDERYLLAMTLEELFDVSNGISLCKDCHILTFKRRKK